MKVLAATDPQPGIEVIDVAEPHSSSSALTRAATSTSARPPASAQPCTPATTGTGSASIRLET